MITGFSVGAGVGSTVASGLDVGVASASRDSTLGILSTWPSSMALALGKLLALVISTQLYPVA